MSPLCNFPLEILSEIFLNVIYLPAVRTMEDGILSIYKSIHNLLGVCSVWRNVVQSRAAFWSLIPIFYPTLDPPGHRATNLSLQRAGDGPLHLAAVISRASSPTVKTLREYIHRFSSINLLSETRSPINEVIKLLLWNNTPLFLRELSIRHVGESAAGKRLPRESEYLISDESFIDHDRFKRLVQSLSAFRMSGIPIHWNAVTFSSQLVELMLDGVTLGFESEVGRFLGALSSATRLRDLRITSVVVFPENLTIDGTDAEDSRVELPSLKTLFFGNLYYNTMRSFSRRLAPGSYHLSLLLTQHCTRTCTIESGDFELMGALFDELCDLVDELGVDMLLLDGNWDEDGDERWLTPDQLGLLLGFTPNLTNLKMNCCNFDAEHWMALTRTGGHPMLENLSLTCASIFDQEGIKNVVTSHQLQRLELGGLVYNLPGCKVLQARTTNQRSLKRRFGISGELKEIFD
ncbi:hypothetical protein FRC11_005947 [Ceratobasidium sp. 423]|nr:hypothetical protein FRC11_005947 [Ceratobasidium sp. 423]